jgi:chromosome segregation ATPase
MAITQADVQKELATTEKDIISNEALIKQLLGRLNAARERLVKIDAEITEVRSQRQTVLVAGDDATALSKRLRVLQFEQEERQDEVAGLTSQISKLKTETETLRFKVEEYRIRIKQIRTVLLAKQYNNLASQFADTVRELNEINRELESVSNANHRVTFYQREGALERIPRVFFDEEILELEAYVAKYRQGHPAHYPVEQRCFYDWEAYLNEIIRSRNARVGL